MKISRKTNPKAIQLWEETSFDMGMIEGRAEGIAEGKTEGIAAGEIMTLKNIILYIVQMYFPSISASINKKIQCINEPDALYDLIDATQKQFYAVDFERTVDATLHMAGAK
ncbi:MAG: hypothetical protein LBR22_10110 [Desulfovibrio sp.]|jgi:hypothetical protein|nr:hypothetical protein [Desulfovibrio sp.]